MKMTRRQRRLKRLHKAGPRAVSVNIIPMIDVFAVLVFFLLASASLAAAKLNVIDLNLPSPDKQPIPENQELRLTATVRQGVIEIADSRGAVRNIPNTPAGYNYTALAELLVQVKQTKPSEQNITLMIEADVPYEEVVKIMDTVRMTPAEARASGLPAEMFPRISVGEARKLDAAEAPGA